MLNQLKILICLLLLSVTNTLLASSDTLNIGVLSFRTDAYNSDAWNHLQNTLQQKLQRDVKIHPLPATQLNQAVSSRSLEFVLTNPGSYVYLREQYGLGAPIASLLRNYQDKEMNAFGGVIFTLVGRDDINNLDDIGNQNIALISQTALGGYLFQAYELFKQHVNMGNATWSFYHDSQDQVVQAVINGKADVGFVRTGVLESLVDAGKLDWTRVKILNRQNLPDYPHVSSTILYPEWPIAALPGVNPDLRRQLAVALIDRNNQLFPEHSSLKTFDLPYNYWPVENLLRELHQAPFDQTNDFTLFEVWHHFDMQIILLLTVLVILVALIIYMYRLNQSLKEAHAKLTSERSDLQQAIQRADEANAYKSQFLAVMSHEVRTPINGVLGTIRLALQNPHKDEKNRYLRKAQDAAGHLSALLDEILDFSKIEAGKMELEHTDFQLAEVIAHVLDIVDGRWSEKNIHFNTRIDLNIPEVLQGDPLRIGQVLINLCHNAAKFSRDGAEVQLIVTSKTRNKNQVSLRFEIRDKGIGMSIEQQQSLFESFKQADGSISRKYGGTGLGLTISKNLVDLMGGQIFVDSCEGVGTSIGFEINIDSADTSAVLNATLREEISTLEQARVTLTGKRILVVEDSPLNQEILVDFLTLENMQVVSVDSGIEALELLPGENFDAIILDCMMPVMDGYETSRQIRNMDGLQKLPIIALTANVLVGDREKALRAGMNDYMTKPLDFEKMLFTLAFWVGSSQKTIKPQNLMHEIVQESSHWNDDLPDLPDIDGVDHSRAIVFSRPQLHRKLLHTFYHEHGGYPAAMQKAINEDNHDQQIYLTHQLKSAADNLGMLLLNALAFELETALRRLQDTKELQISLNAELQKVLSAISSWSANSLRAAGKN